MAFDFNGRHNGTVYREELQSTPMGNEVAVLSSTVSREPALAPAQLDVPQPRSPGSIDVRRFLLLYVQLAALLGVFAGLNTEGPVFFRLASFTFVAFAIHYFTPRPWKQWAFIGLSWLGALWVLADPVRQWRPVGYVGPIQVVGATLGVGLIFYAITRLAMDRRLKVLFVLALAAFLMLWRRELWLGVPDAWFVYIGALFMFRGIVYTFEVYHQRGANTEKLSDFLAYFFMLPNFYFLLFPIVDYATFKKGHGAEDIHVTAQRGISWMVRGSVHLALYRFLYHRLPIAPTEVESVWTLIRFVFSTFLLYLQVSGQFHMAVGMLLLFGYRLPETNRHYLLASSFTDFWRRINIYWKDFMVKVFYYPAYFRLRKRGETLALVMATIWVFVATTLLHGYQLFWLHGKFTVSQGDIFFWSALGVLVLANVLWENRRGKPAKKKAASGNLPRRILQTVSVYVTISVLWSVWSATSLYQWWETVTYWR